MTNGDGGNTNNQGGQSNGGRRRRSLLAGFTLGQPSTARDPLERYQEILSDENLNDEHKRILLEFASRRFRNRQIMAYIALGGILVTLAVVLGGVALNCGGESPSCDFVKNLAEAGNLIGGANALFTAIVASYFGVTSFRPSS